MAQIKVLAADYDGTLATHGHVNAETLQALERFRASGRKVLLVTGREIRDLQTVFSRFDLFELVVAENGAVLYWPETKRIRLLHEPPPARFAKELAARGVSPLSVGQVVVATFEPNETTVLQVIKQLGLELKIIFNKGAVMALPVGVNKATGLAAALAEMGYKREGTVGIGDAENDHAFLDLCGVAAAVSNALPALKERADLVTSASHGAGVAELIELVLKTDLDGVERRFRPQLVLHEHPSVLAGLGVEAGKAP